jgi:hypothetical protein
MTREELCQALPTLAELDADTARQLAVASLLDLLATEGYADVVEAYLGLLAAVDLPARGTMKEKGGAPSTFLLSSALFLACA